MDEPDCFGKTISTLVNEKKIASNLECDGFTKTEQIKSASDGDRMSPELVVKFHQGKKEFPCCPLVTEGPSDNGDAISTQLEVKQVTVKREHVVTEDTCDAGKTDYTGTNGNQEHVSELDVEWCTVQGRLSDSDRLLATEGTNNTGKTEDTGKRNNKGLPHELDVDWCSAEKRPSDSDHTPAMESAINTGKTEETCASNNKELSQKLDVEWWPSDSNHPLAMESTIGTVKTGDICASNKEFLPVLDSGPRTIKPEPSTTSSPFLMEGPAIHTVRPQGMEDQLSISAPQNLAVKQKPPSLDCSNVSNGTDVERIDSTGTDVREIGSPSLLVNRQELSNSDDNDVTCDSSDVGFIQNNGSSRNEAATPRLDGRQELSKSNHLGLLNLLVNRQELLNSDGLDVTRDSSDICFMQNNGSRKNEEARPRLDGRQESPKFNHLNSSENTFTPGAMPEKEKLYCELCGMEYPTISRLRIHMKFHTGQDVEKCPICDEHFEWKNDYKRHLQTKHTPPITCTVCKERYNTIRGYREHRPYHTGEKPFQCSECGISFAMQRQLTRHVNRTHVVEKLRFQSIPATQIKKADLSLLMNQNLAGSSKKSETGNSNKHKSRGTAVSIVVPKQTKQKSLNFYRSVAENSSNDTRVGKIGSEIEHNAGPLSKFTVQDGPKKHEPTNSDCFIVIDSSIEALPHSVVVEKEHSSAEGITDNMHDSSDAWNGQIMEGQTSGNLHKASLPKTNNFTSTTAGKNPTPIERGNLWSVEELTWFTTNGRYCTHCVVRFELFSQFQDHRKGLDGKPPTCKQCKKKFFCNNELQKHVLKHAKTHSCQRCGKTYKALSSLHRHMTFHTGKLRKCNMCDYSTNLEVLYTDHMKEHMLINSRKKTHICKVCGESFVLEREFREHSLTHTKPVLSCSNPKCDKVFSHNHREFLELHEQYHAAKRNIEKVFSCSKCNREFSNKEFMKAHQRSHCEAKRIKESDDELTNQSVDRKLDKTDSLKQICDLVERTSQMPFQCIVCKKRFFSHTELDCHEKIRHIELFQCKNCGKSLATLYEWVKHKNGPFQCNTCDKSFICDGNMEIHMANTHLHSQNGILTRF